MRRFKEHNRSRRRQSGAALVVGLVMLAIITLLAITAMNTSSTELIMAGNEQTRERATQATDAGIEQAVKVLPTVVQDGKHYEGSGTVASTGDTYTTDSVYKGDDLDVPNNSGSLFVGIQYQMVVTGKSKSKNAKAVHTQGAYVLSSKDNTTPWLPGASAP